MDAVSSGAVDIICTCSCFYPKDMPMNNVGWGLFFIPPDPLMQAKIYGNLRKEFPQMDQEVEKYNCKILFMSSVDTYGLFSKTPIKSIADLKGKKISGVGVYIPKFFKEIGTKVIPTFVGDRYSALQTGVIEGDYLPLLFTKPYRFWEVAKYRILVDSGGNHGMPHVINLDVWNSLSPEDQKIMITAGREMEVVSAEWMASTVSVFHKELEEKYGVTLMSFPYEEKVKWCEAIGDKWWDYARDLEKLGLPGFEFVAAYVRHGEKLGFDFPCKQSQHPPKK